MWTAFKNHIQESLPFLLNKKLLLAVSGGVDSMVLLHLFQELNVDIVVAHCNFQLRGAESDLETAFLSDYVKSRNIPFESIFFDTNTYAADHHLSIQIAARKLRYEWFEKVRLAQNCDFVLTAHHADDVVETFLINLTRGTGLEGLQGIPVQNGFIVRPLLPFSREQIATFATQHNISWKEDSSNASTKYFRNKLRHQVIPILKDLNPQFLSVFQDTLQHLKQSQDLVNTAISQIEKKVVTKERELTKLHIVALNEHKASEAFLYAFLKPYGFTSWNDIYTLKDKQSGKMVSSPTHILLKDRDYLVLRPKDENPEITYVIECWEDFERVPFIAVEANVLEENTQVSKKTALFDKNKLKFPLCVRKWQTADYFYPLGLNGKKKLSKYFKDEKFSQFEKDDCWILSQNNEIIWVIGHRQDARFSANDTNINTIKLQVLE